eukprot:g20977.t1
MKRSRGGTKESRGKGGNVLRGVVVCSTGLTNALKDDVRKKVVAMGGSFDVNLTTSTTHLVAASSDTEKYRVATGMQGIVVVRPGWVIESCREGRKLPCDPHAPPPFEGLRITATGLSLDRKAELRAMIESGGGEYMGAMEARTTTHLVAEESHARKLRLPEENFPIAVTPKHRQTHEEQEGAEEEEEEGEEEEERRKEGLTGRHRATPRAGVYDAPTQDSGKKKRPRQPQQPVAEGALVGVPGTSAAADDDAGVPEETRTSTNAAAATDDLLSYPWASTATAAAAVESASQAAAASGEGSGRVEGVPSKEEALALPDGDYLSGCRLMIVGFSAEALLPLSLLVRKGCGIRYTSPNEEITHVVLGDRALAKPDLVSALESHPCSPPVVKALWLLETCRAGRLLPTARYLNRSQAAQGRSRAARSGGGGGGSGGGGGGRGGGGSGGGGGGVGGRRFGVAYRSLGGGSGDGDGGGGSGGKDNSGSGISSYHQGERAGAGEHHRRRGKAQQGGLHQLGGDAGQGPPKRQKTKVGLDGAAERGGGAAAPAGSESIAAPHRGTGRGRSSGNGGPLNSSSSRSSRSSSSKKRQQSWMFHGRVFVVHGTGLGKDDEERVRDLVARHGGLCLGPGDTSSASRARQALRAAGIPLAAAQSAHDDAGAEDDLVAGGRRTDSTTPGSAGAPSPPLVSRSPSRSRPSSAEVTGSRKPAPSSPGVGQRGAVLVVGEHGRCPWAAASIAPCGPDGAGSGGGEGKAGDERGARKTGARAVLEAESRAEVVSLLWVEACHRGGELRRPGSCEKVFRPQPWPIRAFSEGRSSAAAVGGRGEGGCSRRRFPAIAVTGFVGAERSGWEMLIERMGAELCKSLKKRVTTHLVCKEAKGDKYERALQWGVRVVTADWLVRCAEHGYQAGMESSFTASGRASLSPPPQAAAAGVAAEVANENQPPHPPAGVSLPGPKHSPSFRRGSGSTADAYADGGSRGVARDLFASVASLSPGSGGGLQKTNPVPSVVTRNVEAAAAKEGVQADAAGTLAVGTAADHSAPTPPLAADVFPTVLELGREPSPRMATSRTSVAVPDAATSAGAVQPESGERGGGAHCGEITLTEVSPAPTSSPEPRTSRLEQQLWSMLSGARRNGGVAGGIGANNNGVGGPSGLQRPRGRRLRPGAWNGRPTSIRSSPSLSASTTAAGSVATATDAADVAAAAGVDPRSSTPGMGSCRDRWTSDGVDGGGSPTSQQGRLRAAAACSPSGGRLLSGFPSDDRSDGDHDDDDDDNNDDDDVDHGKCHAVDEIKKHDGAQPSPLSLEPRRRQADPTRKERELGRGDEATETLQKRAQPRPTDAAALASPSSPEVACRIGRGSGGGGGSGGGSGGGLDNAVVRDIRCNTDMSGGGVRRLSDGWRRDGATSAAAGEVEAGLKSCSVAATDVNGGAPAMGLGLENELPRERVSKTEKSGGALISADPVRGQCKRHLHHQQRRLGGAGRGGRYLGGMGRGGSGGKRSGGGLAPDPNSPTTAHNYLHQDAFGTEEESQIVTYGEQYNPATGWMRSKNEGMEASVTVILTEETITRLTKVERKSASSARPYVMIQAELQEESKADAVAQALKAAGKTTIPVRRGGADNGNTDRGVSKEEREQKLHHQTRKKRRRILAREADERQPKEEAEDAEELKAQGRLPSDKPVHKDISSRSLTRLGRKQAREAERKNEDKSLAHLCGARRKMDVGSGSGFDST